MTEPRSDEPRTAAEQFRDMWTDFGNQIEAIIESEAAGRHDPPAGHIHVVPLGYGDHEATADETFSLVQCRECLLMVAVAPGARALAAGRHDPEAVRADPPADADHVHRWHKEYAPNYRQASEADDYRWVCNCGAWKRAGPLPDPPADAAVALDVAARRMLRTWEQRKVMPDWENAMMRAADAVRLASSGSPK